VLKMIKIHPTKVLEMIKKFKIEMLY